jgi:large subunit ribosomal protein L16
MGKGKGHGILGSSCKPGTIMFEVGGVTKVIAEEAIRLASHKLPIKTKFVIRPDYTNNILKL